MCVGCEGVVEVVLRNAQAFGAVDVVAAEITAARDISMGPITAISRLYVQPETYLMTQHLDLPSHYVVRMYGLE